MARDFGDGRIDERRFRVNDLKPFVVEMRPVAYRLWRRERGQHPGPPSQAERADAILLLAEPYSDDVGDEAFRILDEYGR